jgi:hypothetical protein
MPFDRAQTIFPIWNSSIYPRHILISITLIITILLLTNNILSLVCSIIGRPDYPRIFSHVFLPAVSPRLTDEAVEAL